MPIFERLSNQARGAFYGWRMVAAGCVMRMLGGAFHLYGFTIFFLPITNELGLSRAPTSLVFSLARAEGGIEGPLAGYVYDRHQRYAPLMNAYIAIALVAGLLYASLRQAKLPA